MITLFTFGETRETEPAFPELGLRAWRWALTAYRWSVALEMQVKFLKENRDWRGAVEYYSVQISRRSAWGFDHGWYDGPHCSLSLGFLHFAWSGWKGHCRKCCGE